MSTSLHTETPGKRCSFMKGYCIGYDALHSLSSSASAAGDIWESRGCVWSAAPRCFFPYWRREPLPPHDYNCKSENTGNMSALVIQNLFMTSLVVYESIKKHACSPHDLVFFSAVLSSVFAVIVIVQKRRGLFLVAPLQHLALGLTVCWGIFVFQVPWFAVEWVGDEAQVPFLILFKTDWHNAWERGKRCTRDWLWVLNSKVNSFIIKGIILDNHLSSYWEHALPDLFYSHLDKDAHSYSHLHVHISTCKHTDKQTSYMKVDTIDVKNVSGKQQQP